jgi:hypothetical protein
MTFRQTGRQTGKQTDVKIDSQAARLTGKWTDGQTGRQAGEQTNKQINKHTGRQRDRWTNWRTDRQMDKLADLQTDRQTDRQTHKETELRILKTSKQSFSTWSTLSFTKALLFKTVRQQTLALWPRIQIISSQDGRLVIHKGTFGTEAREPRSGFGETDPVFPVIWESQDHSFCPSAIADYVPSRIRRKRKGNVGTKGGMGNLCEGRRWRMGGWGCERKKEYF